MTKTLRVALGLLLFLVLCVCLLPAAWADDGGGYDDVFHFYDEDWYEPKAWQEVNKEYIDYEVTLAVGDTVDLYSLPFGIQGLGIWGEQNTPVKFVTGDGYNAVSLSQEFPTVTSSLPPGPYDHTDSLKCTINLSIQGIAPGTTTVSFGYGTIIIPYNAIKRWYTPRITIHVVDSGDMVISSCGLWRGPSSTFLWPELYWSEPTASRNGWELAGWFDQAEGGNQIEDFRRINEKTMPFVYAHWTPDLLPDTCELDFLVKPVDTKGYNMYPEDWAHLYMDGAETFKAMYGDDISFSFKYVEGVRLDLSAHLSRDNGIVLDIANFNSLRGNQSSTTDMTIRWGDLTETTRLTIHFISPVLPDITFETDFTLQVGKVYTAKLNLSNEDWFDNYIVWYDFNDESKFDKWVEDYHDGHSTRFSIQPKAPGWYYAAPHIHASNMRIQGDRFLFAVADEYGNVPDFFQNLKDAVERGDREFDMRNCGRVVFTESITIPNTTKVHASGTEIVIPDGVTLTVENYCRVGTLTVQSGGHVTVSDMDGAHLRVDDALNYNNVNQFTVNRYMVIGLSAWRRDLENLNFGEKGGLTVSSWAYNDSELAAALAGKPKLQNDKIRNRIGIRYDCTLVDDMIVDDFNLAVEDSGSLTIPAGKTLICLNKVEAQDGPIYLQGRMISVGYGQLSLQWEESATALLNISGEGFYAGKQIHVYAPKDRRDACISGLDMSKVGKIINPDFTAYFPPMEVVLPDELTALGGEAFANDSFHTVYIPAGVTSIAPDAFSGTDVAIIFGVVGSYAEEYAADSRIPFLRLPSWYNVHEQQFVIDHTA